MITPQDSPPSLMIPGDSWITWPSGTSRNQGNADSCLDPCSRYLSSPFLQGVPGAIGLMGPKGLPGPKASDYEHPTTPIAIDVACLISTPRGFGDTLVRGD